MAYYLGFMKSIMKYNIIKLIQIKRKLKKQHII